METQTRKMAAPVRLLLHADVFKHFVTQTEASGETLSYAINKALLAYMAQEEQLNQLVETSSS